MIRRMALPLFLLFAMSAAQSREAMLFCGAVLVLWGAAVLFQGQREQAMLQHKVAERDQLLTEIEEIAEASLSSKAQLVTAQD